MKLEMEDVVKNVGVMKEGERSGLCKGYNGWVCGRL